MLIQLSARLNADICDSPLSSTLMELVRMSKAGSEIVLLSSDAMTLNTCQGMHSELEAL